MEISLGRLQTWYTIWISSISGYSSLKPNIQYHKVSAVQLLFFLSFIFSFFLSYSLQTLGPISFHHFSPRIKSNFKMLRLAWKHTLPFIVFFILNFLRYSISKIYIFLWWKSMGECNITANQSSLPEWRNITANQSSLPEGRNITANQSSLPEGRNITANQSSLPEWRTITANQSSLWVT